MVDSDSSPADSVEPPSTEDRPPTERSGVGENTQSPAPNYQGVDPAQLGPGSVLGPYRLESTLGKGGMGTVFKATHTKLGKTVAVKVLAPHLTRHKESVARFQREMLAVGRLTHPHIVQAHDAGEIQGTHYLAMEYVDGSDLGSTLKKHGPLSATNACKVVRQAALALSTAHAAGLIHRDIKPSNLLLSRTTGQIKILDLGLARLVNNAESLPELTVAGEMFGTPDFMSPEQWMDSHTADPRTDLYALGCTLYYLLTGHAPFGTPQFRLMTAKMQAHVLEPIPDLQQAAPHIPDGVAAIYRKLMEKQPEDRFQTAQELADALQPFASSRSAASASTAPVGETLPVIVTETVLPPKPPAKTNRAGLFGGGLAGLVLLAGIVIIITNKDGTKTKVEVPAGTRKVEIAKDGKMVATVTPTEDEPVPPTEQRLKFFMQQREVAEFVLSRGGKVFLEWEKDFDSEQRENSYQPGKEIPAGAFIVRNIDLADPTITGADLTKLTPARRMNFLQLTYAKLTENDAIHLKALPNIHAIGLEGSSLKTSWLPDLIAPYTLAVTTDMVDDRWSLLRRCPNLRHLLIVEGAGGAAALDMMPLGKHPQLRWLELRDYDIAAEIVEKLQHDNPRLLVTTKGRLAGRNPMVEPALKLIDRGVVIYAMGRLFDANPTAQTLTPQEFDNGEPWRIVDIRFDDQHLATVEDARELTAFAGLLTNVGLFRQNQGDEIARALAELGFLYSLTFAESDLTDAGLAALDRFDKLRYLDVRGNPAITKTGIDAFHRAVPACRLLNDYGEIAADIAAEPQRAAAEKLDK